MYGATRDWSIIMKSMFTLSEVGRRVAVLALLAFIAMS
jgi:hypothetical protein